VNATADGARTGTSRARTLRIVVDTADLIFGLGFVLLLAAFAGWIARRLGLPDVIGWLVTGILVGPSTPGFVADRTEIAVLADIGVVLLLFEVGLEIDLGRIRRESRTVLWAAPLQVFVTLGISTAFVGLLLGTGPVTSAILGLAVASSSSAVIASLTGGDLHADRALETAMSWSGVQDLVTVVLAAVLFSMDGIDDLPLPLALGGLAVYAVAVVLVARILPGILQRLLDAEDVFVLVSLAIAIVLAGSGALIFHVPVALAAFVGGLAITEGRETLRLRRELVPFRVVFSVFFFVSIGFVFDPSQLATALPLLGLFITLIVLAKAAVIAGIGRATRLTGQPVLVGTALGQMGEFGFVIASTLLVQHAIAPSTFAAVIAAVAISVAASTILYRALRRMPRHAGAGGAGRAEAGASRRHADPPAEGAA
jgi:CPA2 family monovalent cation:H+ antiporter-2